MTSRDYKALLAATLGGIAGSRLWPAHRLIGFALGFVVGAKLYGRFDPPTAENTPPASGG
jgi:hypothetical protein